MEALSLRACSLRAGCRIRDPLLEWCSRMRVQFKGASLLHSVNTHLFRGSHFEAGSAGAGLAGDAGDLA